MFLTNEPYIHWIYEGSTVREKCFLIVYFFLDEADSLFGDRSKGGGNDSARKVVNTLLSEVEDKPDDVFLLCSTNCPWDIDSAFRRRFNKMVYVPLPGLVDRGKIFRTLLEKQFNYLTARDYHFLAEITKNYSPSDITNICNEVLQQSMYRTELVNHFKKDPHNNNLAWPCLPTDGGEWAKIEMVQDQLLLPPINMKDIERAMWCVKRSGELDDLPKLLEFAKKYGQDIPPLDD
jgi:vacuolar protein-sorting-associated protein 4